MKRGIHTVVIIVFLILINIVSIYQFRHQIQEVNIENEALHRNFADLNSNSTLTQQAWATASAGEDSFLLYEYLEDPIPNGAIAIRISDLQCSSCVDFLLFQIRKLYSDKEIPELLILYSATDEKTILFPSRLRLMRHATFINIPEDVAISPLDDLRIPYLLSLNKEGEVLSTFLPENVEESIIEIYLKHATNNLITL